MVNTNDVSETFEYVFVAVVTPSFVVPEIIELPIDNEEIVAEFFGVALIVHNALDLYLIKVESSPVSAIVVSFMSLTVASIAGLDREGDAVIFS